MKPKNPFIQTFDKLPQQLPVHRYGNALLPGGELPLELSSTADLSLFFSALKSDQLIGLMQAPPEPARWNHFKVGCAGRIRQYRERKDGRLNVMLTGVCRFRVVQEMPHADGYSLASVDWSDFENDYAAELVDANLVVGFKQKLRSYFKQHNMQVDWKILDENPIEHVLNNLVLVVNLDADSKQRLLESVSVTERLVLFADMLEQQTTPFQVSPPNSAMVN